jgi:hypothetical protein
MKNRPPLLALGALLLAALACNISLDTASSMSSEQIETYSAQTMAMIAWQTSAAQGTLAPPPAADTQQPPPPAADTPTGEILPTVTWTGTQPSTNTFTPSVTLTAVPCNWVQFISDVTIPDNWETTPNDHFTKTWRLKNIGSCTWTSGYALVFDHGDQMGAPASQQLTTGTVAPGQTIDVSVDLLSPAADGTYQGYFKLKASDSSIFGIGASADGAFWVKIVVKTLLAPPVVAPTTQQVVKNATIPAGGTYSTTAYCPSGTVVTGGGFSVSTDVHVYTQAMNGNGWTAVAKNNNGSTARPLNVYAICLTYPSASTTMVDASVTVVGGGGLGTQKANCPSGSVVTGGGFTGKADGSIWTFFSAQVGNGWQVSARNYGGSSQSFNVYGVCLTAPMLATATYTGYKDLDPGDTGLAEIGCPAGEAIAGGGWNLDTDLKVFAALMSSGKWRVYAKNTGTHTRSLQSRVTCVGIS